MNIPSFPSLTWERNNEIGLKPVKKYSFVSNLKNHMQLQGELTKPLWPEFMMHDPVADKYWSSLFELFPDYQISLLLDDEIIGIANSIPFRWNDDLEYLPEQGWDWAFEKGVEDFKNNIKPNALCGLQIAVKKEFQGKGLSTIIVKELIRMARINNFSFLTIPVRPSLKSKYPVTSIDEYITWKRDDGLPFDPWLRVHVKCGGKIIKPCCKAMYISGHIKEWEEWTGLTFFRSGKHIVEGALTPVSIDREADLGEYIEPNVWVVHRIGEE